MIIKRYLSILGLLLLSNTTHADQLYYGLALINQQLTQDIQTVSPASISTVKETGTGLGLYADYFYKGDYRFNGTFSYISYNTFSFISLTASADYLFPIDSNFTLFTGVTAGVAGMKFNDASAGDMSLGTLYGIQAGAIAFLSNGIMIELGYRIRPASVETDILDPATKVLIATSTVDELNETYLNLVITF
jgi:hypothetical protein